MGDSMDFVEWSATVEMLANAKKQMAFLEPEKNLPHQLIPSTLIKDFHITCRKIFLS